MILTVTLNAALDVTYGVDRLRPGSTHRVADVRTRAGGKGINVARVLHSLGHDTLATGLAGGATGAEIRADLERAGVPHALMPVAGDARRTVTVLSTEDATVLTEPGPPIADAEWAEFLAVYGDLARQAAVVVLSGSLPPGLPRNAYAQLIGATDAITILDTSDGALMSGLRAHPDVVKPNFDELPRATAKLAAWQEMAAGLRRNGARSVVASRGPDGLLAVTDDGSWRARPPEPLPGNPTGAGDACVAAIAAGLAEGTPWPALLAEAVAVSAAAVVCRVAGDVDLPTYHRVLPGVVVEESHAHADR